MAGSSAKQWAIKQNIPTCDDEAMISSTRFLSAYCRIKKDIVSLN